MLDGDAALPRKLLQQAYSGIGRKADVELAAADGVDDTPRQLGSALLYVWRKATPRFAAKEKHVL